MDCYVCEDSIELGMYHVAPSLCMSVDHIQGKSLVRHFDSLGNVVALSIEFCDGVRSWNKLALVDFQVFRILERRGSGSRPMEYQGIVLRKIEVAAFYIPLAELDRMKFGEDHGRHVSKQGFHRSVHVL